MDYIKEYELWLEKVTDSEKQALNQKLNAMSKKTVTVRWAVDNTLLGGVIVEMNGKVLDGSIKRQLSEVKEVIGK